MIVISKNPKDSVLLIFFYNLLLTQMSSYPDDNRHASVPNLSQHWLAGTYHPFFGGRKSEAATHPAAHYHPLDAGYMAPLWMKTSTRLELITGFTFGKPIM
jgi:hypothetical protein